MKAFALTATILGLTVLAHGFVDYNLQCNHDEVGIRWPSYHSNSDYYMCTRIGGRQIKMNCNPGELFTFVLQACTSPSQFIPPPPMDILPISSLNQLPSREQPAVINQPNTAAALPKPIYPTENHQRPAVILAPQSPPMFVDENSQPAPPNLDIFPLEPTHEKESGVQEETGDIKEEEKEAAAAPVLKPAPPSKQKPVPMPPTPEPTPPVVKKPPSVGKKAPPTALKGKAPSKSPQRKPTSVARKPKPASEARKPKPATEARKPKPSPRPPKL